MCYFCHRMQCDTTSASINALWEWRMWKGLFGQLMRSSTTGDVLREDVQQGKDDIGSLWVYIHSFHDPTWRLSITQDHCTNKILSSFKNFFFSKLIFPAFILTRVSSCVRPVLIKGVPLKIFMEAPFIMCNKRTPRLWHKYFSNH